MHLSRWFALFVVFTAAVARAGDRISLDSGWKFHLNDPEGVDPKQFNYPEVRDLAKASKDDTEQEAKLAAGRIDAVKTNLGGDLPVVATGYDDSKWESVDVPHDWVVGLGFENPPGLPGWLHDVIDSHGYKAIRPGVNDVGWYRKALDIPAVARGGSLSIVFDGVYRNSIVWLNGRCLGRNVSGYAGCEYDISSLVNYGGKNELVVRVDASRVEGWFYEGAGIYRHVWLNAGNPIHVVPGSLHVETQVDGKHGTTMHVHCVVRNDSAEAAVVKVLSMPYSPAWKQGQGVPGGFTAGRRVQPGEEILVDHTLPISNPMSWSLETPNQYRVKVSVEGRNVVYDTVEIRTGIRTVNFDPDHGLFLNGDHVEIRGTCNHQDAGGVGSAIPDSLNYWRLEQLKKFGCNAIRTSHNPPTPELLDACDRLGILVMDEVRKSGDSPEQLDQLRRMVLRDRNHPCVVLWSIGNEENQIQGDDTVGTRVAQNMKKVILELDTTRPITAAMNGGWGHGFSRVIDVQGFNYGGNLDQYHKDHLNQPMFGSENGSTVSTRGVYTNDRNRGYVSAYDVNAPPWATTAEKWVNDYRARPFMAGGFVWTGFDYRGEPTPYGWPCVNSHFGLLDTCGFFKDNAYYYQSVWTDAPMVHLLPHWNHEPGQTIDVWAYSNGDEVELLLNDQSLGRKKYPAGYHVSWKVPYVPGKLEARAYKAGKTWATDTVETAGPPMKVVVTCDRNYIAVDGRDTACVAVQIVDAQNRPCPTASNLVHLKVDGSGRRLGVCNGDPSCHEPDRADQRSAFNGKCMLVVQSIPNQFTTPPPPVTVTASADGLESGSIKLEVVPGN